MTRLSHLRVVLLAISLFGIVFGANLWVLDRFGSDMPNWDQWDAEGTNLYLPYFQHRLGLPDLFAPHNEHRVVFTKAFNLGLLLANGQWDARVQCAANSALHSLFAAMAFLGGCHVLAARWRAPLFAICALLVGLPISWQNLIGGFHSPQYFLLLLSFGTIALLCFARTGSGAWWAGLVLAVLANFTLGSGFFAAAAVAGTLTIRALCRHTTWRAIWPTLAGCAIPILVGVLTRTSVSGHEFLMARSLHDFIFTVVNSLRWPAISSPWLALVVYAPAALFVWSALRWRRDDVRDRENLLFASLIWLLLQFAAAGYARGADAPDPASRYLDTVTFGLLVNVVALAFLLDFRSITRGWRIACWLLGALWIGVVAQGLWHHVNSVVTGELPRVGAWLRDGEYNLRAYLATNDYARIEGRTIPYPSADALRERLSHPELRALMPASVRPAVQLEAADGISAVFSDGGTAPGTPPSDHGRTWGSYSSGGTAAQGEWRSTVFTPVYDGYLKIEMAGYPGGPGLSLSVLDAATGKPLADAQPWHVPGNAWRSAYVRVPRRPIVLLATDRSPDSWFAFSDPVEMTTLSYRAWWLVKQGRLILYLAAAAGLLLCSVDTLQVWKPQLPQSPRK